MNPYRHTGYGKTVEEAVSEALSTFDEDNPLFPNEQVFITDATDETHYTELANTLDYLFIISSLKLAIK